MSIEVGDIVKLKKGGPPMYVHNVNDPKSIHCSWSSSNEDEDMYFFFDSDNLEIIEKLTKISLI